MRKALTDKIFIITALLAVSITVSSYIIIKNADEACGAQKCCKERSPSKNDILWDAFPRQFITSILFR